MASRKSSKEKVVLFGGPLHGHTVKLSKSVPLSGCFGRTATLMIDVHDEIGRYINGRWNPYEDPTVLNENIVLGEM
jgi:hypothetical protein